MRIAVVTLAVFALGASRGGCGMEARAPHEPCVGKACGDPCAYCPPDATEPCPVPASASTACNAGGECVPLGSFTCPGQDPCADKPCGAECNPCAPEACMNPVAHWCDSSHECVTTVPECAAPAGCTVDGTTYADGDTFPAPDRCNTCYCHDGQAVCTLMMCSGTWYYTCGDPACHGWAPDPSIPLCTTEKAGDGCMVLGSECDPQSYCNERLVCATSDPTLVTMDGVARRMCPISRASYKTDIQYLGGAELDRVRAELLNIRLATYRYRAGGPSASTQLGFIIDDMGSGPWVNADGETVNLYGYTSMAVAALQAQERELAALREEVASLRRKVEAKPARRCRP